MNTVLDEVTSETIDALASRVVGRSHFDALSLDDMRGYLVHPAP